MASAAVSQNAPPEAASTAVVTVDALQTSRLPDAAPLESATIVSGPSHPDIPSREIVVEARRSATPGDPLQAINRQSFAVAQKVDEAIVGPVAHAYEHAVPKPVRSGVRNFLNNTREPIIFLSFLLELKPGKAGETLGRFAINSTIGVAGLVDIAKRKPFRLPRRPNGFADALGYYGVRPGPFLFLPLIGPTTLRDAIGGAADRLVLPLAVGTPFNQFAYSAGTGALSALDRRIEFDGQLQRLRDTSNPYASRRVLYLRQRRIEIDGLHSHRKAPEIAAADPLLISGGVDVPETAAPGTMATSASSLSLHPPTPGGPPGLSDTQDDQASQR